MKDIGILIFDDVDLLDFTGPKEVFHAVKTKKNITIVNPNDIYEFNNLIHVRLVSIGKNIITTADGTKIYSDLTLEELKYNFDAIVIPGGKGIHNIKHQNQIHNFINAHKKVPILSVCTGAYAILESKIITDGIMTTHSNHFQFIEKLYPDIKIIQNKKYVINNNVIFAGGVSAGIDGALYLVKLLFNEIYSKNAANLLNYEFN